LIAVLFAILGLLTLAYIGTWIASLRERGEGAPTGATNALGWPTPGQLLIGFGTDFLDTLGIGNFATTTSLFRFGRMVPDELIPGTLNAGHTLPVITEAFIYIAIIEVDVTTLFLMIGAAVAGAWFGAGVVARLPRRRIQIGMGIGLLVAAGLMLMTQLQLFPAGGDTLGLGGVRLAVGLSGSLVLGALMTLGIGFYAPCMILVALLGMNPKAAFPIMMGACAFLMPVASMRFVRTRRYSLRPALGLTLGGIPAVLLAAYIVKTLELGTVRWLVIVVVVYTAIAMLRSAAIERRDAVIGQRAPAVLR
jgi:uncharacterized membrane protein YfcA